MKKNIIKNPLEDFQLLQLNDNSYYIANDDSVDIDATLASDYYLTINKDNKVVINTVVKSLDNEYAIDIEM